MITEECDHNKYTNNDESNNINNDKMIVVSTIRFAFVIKISVEETMSRINITIIIQIMIVIIGPDIDIAVKAHSRL